MKKADLKNIIQLIKGKLCNEPEPACGVFWGDSTSESVVKSDLEQTQNKNSKDSDISEAKHGAGPAKGYTVSDSDGEEDFPDPSVTTKYGIFEPPDF